MTSEKLLNGKEQSFCFVESFDSVRYAGLSIEKKDERRIQAEVELIFSLLLGERIVVPEAHSFDSVGFLKIATDALNSRPSTDKEWIREPFLLCLRSSYYSYLDMIAASFRRKEFILSALPEVDKDYSFRGNLAEKIEAGNFREIEKETANSSDQTKEFFQNIEQLNNYFTTSKRREAKNLGSALERYIRNLIDRNDFSPHLMMQDGFRELREGLKTLIRNEVQFTNRGTVRNEGERYIEDYSTYLGIVEYVDSCYNAVIYKAVGAETGILTTTESTKGKYIVLAQDLSEESAELGAGDTTRMWINEQDSLKLKSWIRDRKDRWQQTWKILSDDRWIRSVRNFLTAPIETKRNAYRSHMNTLKSLTEDLPGISIEIPEEFSQEIRATSENESIAKFEHILEAGQAGNSECNQGCIDGKTPGLDL